MGKEPVARGQTLHSPTHRRPLEGSESRETAGLGGCGRGRDALEGRVGTVTRALDAAERVLRSGEGGKFYVMCVTAVENSKE